MTLICFIVYFLLAAAGPAADRSRHVITPPANSLEPTSLAWDPSAQHFLISSSRIISSVSDAGVIQTLTLDANSSSISSIAVDSPRRRLLVASSSTISAFDLRSLRPLFTSSLPFPPSFVTLSSSTGTAFIAASNQILTADLTGKISPLAHVSAEICGLAHVSRGFLLATVRDGGMVKLDEDDGTARRVLVDVGSTALALAVKSDGAATVAGEGSVRLIESGDSWAEANVLQEVKVGEGEEERVAGVAVREGKRVYVLVVKGEGMWRIEEVEWKEEGEMVWAMVLVGLGLAYFMYWRFQMGKLVTSVNKKRA